MALCENADRVQNLQLLLLLLLLPATSHQNQAQLQRLQQILPRSSEMPAFESLSDFDQKPSRLLPGFPTNLPPPLDHLVGGGGDQLPRAALLSWGGTLLVLVGGRTARGAG